jgi:hypothetical protein
VLTDQQRADLDKEGVSNVRGLLMHAGRGWGALVQGFRCGDLTRGDVADWLAEKDAEDVRVRDSTLLLAKIAAIGTVVSVIVGIAPIWFAK